MRLLANKRGDTIIEVMIAIAIVSFTLVSSYALSNTNVRRSMTIKEQGEAQKLAERQVELFRQQSNTIDMSGKCFDESAAITTSCAAVDATGKAINPATYNNAAYTIDINKNITSGTYAINVSWTTVSGEKSTITLYYYV